MVVYVFLTEKIIFLFELRIPCQRAQGENFYNFKKVETIGGNTVITMNKLPKHDVRQRDTSVNICKRKKEEL